MPNQRTPRRQAPGQAASGPSRRSAQKQKAPHQQPQTPRSSGKRPREEPRPNTAAHSDGESTAATPQAPRRSSGKHGEPIRCAKCAAVLWSAEEHEQHEERRHSARAASEDSKCAAPAIDAARNAKTSEAAAAWWAQQRSPADLVSRQRLVSELRTVVVNAFGPAADVRPFGSFASGLWTRESDVDIAVILPEREYPTGALSQQSQPATKRSKMNDPTHQFEVRTLRKLRKHLYGFVAGNDVEMIAHAKVPILRCGPCKHTGLSFDANVGRDYGCANSLLVADYLLLDPRAPVVVAAARQWGKLVGATLMPYAIMSPYALVICVLCYLQLRGVLPCLHSSELVATNGEKVFCAEAARKGQPMPEWARGVATWKSSCAASVADLLVGFFSWVAVGVDWHREALSLRLGRVVAKSELGVEPDATVVVEEPLQRTNLGSRVSQDSLDVLVDECRCVAYALMNADPGTPDFAKLLGF
eukprot:m51a1_g1561 hypothetical protein (473) ;mRNA; f:36372-37790